MDRRGFLIETLRSGSVLLILPAGWTLASCGGGTTGTAVPPVATANSLQFTSDTMGNHTHDFFVDMQDFTRPPAEGVSGDTTVTLGHSHAVVLSETDLATIEAGEAVSKSTSVVAGHQHTFKFALPTDGGSADAPA